MKNKLVIIILACFIVIVGVVGFIVYDNRTVSTITLDINPSLEIELDKNSRIKKISALNSDAKDVVDNIKEKDLDLFFEKLKDNLDKKGYTSDRLVILMYTKGDIDKEETKNIIFKKFNDVDIEIISVDNITEEDIKLAKKYNITASKAAYINSISKKNNIKVDNLLNRNIKELKETSESGNYCDMDIF